MKPQQITYDICRHYLSDNIDTLPADIYNKLTGFLRQRNIDKLATCTTLLSPTLVGRDMWRTLMQVEAFFKKNVSFSDAERCRQSAMSSFNRGERICRITNRRLEFYYLHSDRLDPTMKLYLSRMRGFINDTLGPYHDFLEQLPKLVRVTSGATSTKSRRQAVPFLRISKRPYASRRAAPYLTALGRYFGYGTVRVRRTATNRVEFVPKNWKTDRTIACEPEGNMFLQLAFDRYAKRRLKRKGINLSSQFRNQILAKQGSVDGSYATVDLSMASDTLAFNCVASLFPQSWFRYLNDVRSYRSRGGVEIDYAKFSSMGNGCTFALETLVFAAACRAVGSRSSVVYGDDIVIETKLVPELMRVLRFLGFLPNDSKTHLAGPFRESCGANWFGGVDITPKYLREIDRRKATLCHVVNSMLTITGPGLELWDYLLFLVRNYKLPLTPFSDQTTAGVFITEEAARSLKLLSSRDKYGVNRWVTKAKAYVPVSPRRSNRDSRSLFLWYLDTSVNEDRTILDDTALFERRLRVKQTGVPFVRENVVRSRYTISSHRYRRKWVHWREPVAGAPVQLTCWTEQILASAQADP